MTFAKLCPHISINIIIKIQMRLHTLNTGGTVPVTLKKVLVKSVQC